MLQSYDFSCKVTKKLLSVIFKFNMISAWHGGQHFNDFMSSFVDIIVAQERN